MLSGPSRVADQRLGAVEDIGLVVQRREPLAGPGEADGDRAAMDLGRVEDVERAGAVEGDEVGDVDERRDRAQTDGAQAVLEPLRRGTVFHAAHEAAIKDGTGLVGDVGREMHADRTGEASGYGFDRGGDQPPEAAGGEVARDAGDAERVGTVGGDGDVDDGIGGVEVDVAGADRSVGVELDDAVMRGGELHLAFRQHHAVAFDTADLSDLDCGVDAGDVVAGRGDHDLDACARVGGAADDLKLAGGGQHLADAQFIGVGMLLGLENMTDGEGRETLGGVRDALDLEAEIGQGESDLVEGGVGLQMLLEPGEREFHETAPDVPGRGLGDHARLGKGGETDRNAAQEIRRIRVVLAQLRPAGRRTHLGFENFDEPEPLADQFHVGGEAAVAGEKRLMPAPPGGEAPVPLALVPREGRVDRIEAADGDFERFDDRGGPARAVENDVTATDLRKGVAARREIPQRAAGRGLDAREHQREQFVGQFGAVAEGKRDGKGRIGHGQSLSLPGRVARIAPTIRGSARRSEASIDHGRKTSRAGSGCPGWHCTENSSMWNSHQIIVSANLLMEVRRIERGSVRTGRSKEN